MSKLNIENCIHVTRTVYVKNILDDAWQQNPYKELVGTFKYIDNTLYFFDAFSKEWEEFNYNFNILNKKEIKEIKRKLEVI